MKSRGIIQQEIIDPVPHDQMDNSAAMTGIMVHCGSMARREGMRQIELSPSSLSLFEECPLCFWLEKVEGIKRPRGIFPSLPGGMDTIIKSYFDGYRAKGQMPPELRGKVRGALFPDAGILKRWRSPYNKKDPCYVERPLNAILFGALDDCLVEGNRHIPLDYKTRGYDLRADSSRYYETQLNCYALMLESSGYPTAGFAYLVFYWPLGLREGGEFTFKVEPVRVTTDIEASRTLFRNAVRLLSSPRPRPNPDCEYCALVSRRQESERRRILI